MRVRWSESALSDIDDVFSYIHEHNRTAAAAVVDRIKAVAGLLQEFPEAGHLTEEPDVRIFPPFAILIWCSTRSILQTQRS
jgi:plasmid stabilization system protein ParE